MLPNALRTSPLRIVRPSPELLSVSVPKFPVVFMFTVAVVVPMVTAEVLVGTPAFQFEEVPQLLSPPPPVHESAVSGGGGALRWAKRAAATVVESLRFEFDLEAAEAVSSSVNVASRQRAVIHSVTRRGDEGRMRASKNRNLSANRTGAWHN